MLTMYSEPPRTMKSMPQPKVLKAPPFPCGLTAFKPATITVQTPLDRRIRGTRLSAEINASIQAAIRTATIIRKTPRVKSRRWTLAKQSSSKEMMLKIYTLRVYMICTRESS